MGMEPFDYLTYKRNKVQNRKVSSSRKKEKLIVGVICTVTFAVFFFAVMHYVASKSAKIDIEYGRMGQPDSRQVASDKISEGDRTAEAEEQSQERFTIDKRLFLIRQEEKGPSESKVVSPPKEQSEVISKREFEMIKNNSDEVVHKAEKQIAQRQMSKTTVSSDDTEIGDTETETGKLDNGKAMIKPKLPLAKNQGYSRAQTPNAELLGQPSSPSFKTMGALEIKTIPAKVLIGKYATMEEVRKVQAELPEMSDNSTPFVKKINNYYSIQVGAYQSFEIAKTVAGKLKQRGFDVWILQ